MNPRQAAVVDYGAGNVVNLQRTLQALGYRARITQDPAVLERADVVVLPGVGAFPAAMAALQERGLVAPLQALARAGRPIVGICLGMQLLAQSSSEYGNTDGLGLIPGQVRSLGPGQWHIGWNTLQSVGSHSLMAPSHGQSVYFNHSFVFEAQPACLIGQVQPQARGPRVTAAVQHGNVVGLQFHPEKSQAVGRALLRHVIEGLCHAA